MTGAQGQGAHHVEDGKSKENIRPEKHLSTAKGTAKTRQRLSENCLLQFCGTPYRIHAVKMHNFN